MKILYVIDSLGTGGAERSTSYLWYYLREHRVDVKILCLRKRKEGIQEEILKAGFDVEFLRDDSWLGHAKQIRSIVEKYNPDVVHSILWKSNIRTRVARFLRPFYHIESLVNLVYSETRIQDVGRFKLNAYKWIDKLTGALWVDYFHANGENVARHYCDKLSIATKKISIVKRGRFPNTCLDRKDELKKEFRKRYAIAEDEIILINVGRHEYQKGHDVLLDALNEVRKSSIQKVKLFVAGRDGNATGIIQAKIKQLGLERDVTLLGHSNNISELLVCGDIFVFPSRFEGFPGSLIEAEAAGLPIVCTNLPMMLEVAIPGVNCEIFQTEQSGELAQAIVKMATSPRLREQYGENSLRQFKDNFLIPVINEKMYAMYQQLIHAKK